MKLELKHLAPYLPYGLSIKNSIGKVIELTVMDFCYHLDKGFKPILRPLSDLKEGDFGEYLIEEFYTLDFEKQILRILEDNRWVNQCDYLLIQLLIENHYDVFGLIDKGLAIDINTIKQ